MNEKDRRELENIVAAMKEAADIEEIYLFGSFAYGEPTKESDFDLYVLVSDKEERALKVLRRLYCALPKQRERAVDILTNKKETFYKRSRSEIFEREIREKGVKIYERERRRSQSMA